MARICGVVWTCACDRGWSCARLVAPVRGIAPACGIAPARGVAVACGWFCVSARTRARGFDSGDDVGATCRPSARAVDRARLSSMRNRNSLSP
ncbi:hypothetical protein Ade02nite_53210 [Paractinoplanes deccanensis]|uniref:Uncharacterized protein n=1 Tax=Paractinoplanes deccanensis TaxID=113561 RepID=A0ABQ3YA25_9ACTN|nr:hypothetical protein Ade02nite_53210 [Actinoplanes deccanensis]